jgi:L-amino acid N-acyltransferase YncA
MPTDDTPIFYLWLRRHAASFCDDYETVSAGFAWQLARQEAVWQVTVAAGTGSQVGFLWLTQCTPGLHASVHGLVWPKAWRPLLGSGLVQAWLSQRCQEAGYCKLKAEAMGHQRAARRVLQGLGFVEVATLCCETMYQGQHTAVSLYEWRPVPSRHRF